MLYKRLPGDMLLSHSWHLFNAVILFRFSPALQHLFKIGTIWLMGTCDVLYKRAHYVVVIIFLKKCLFCVTLTLPCRCNFNTSTWYHHCHPARSAQISRAVDGDWHVLHTTSFQSCPGIAPLGLRGGALSNACDWKRAVFGAVTMEHNILTTY